MLRRLLHLALAQGTVDIVRLALETGASPRQVRQAIEALERLDYLEEAAAGGTACKSCPWRTTCGLGNSPRLWRLTRRGERAILR